MLALGTFPIFVLRCSLTRRNPCFSTVPSFRVWQSPAKKKPTPSSQPACPGVLFCDEVSVQPYLSIEDFFPRFALPWLVLTDPAFFHSEPTHGQCRLLQWLWEEQGLMQTLPLGEARQSWLEPRGGNKDIGTCPQLWLLHKRGVHTCVWHHCPELSPKTCCKF